MKRTKVQTLGELLMRVTADGLGYEYAFTCGVSR